MGRYMYKHVLRALQSSLLFSAFDVPGFSQQRWLWGFVDVCLFSLSLYAYKNEKLVYFYNGNLFKLQQQQQI